MTYFSLLSNGRVYNSFNAFFYFFFVTYYNFLSEIYDTNCDIIII